MREPNDATIPIRMSPSDVLDKKTEPLPKGKLGWKMRRPSIIAILIALMLSVGWGAWTFLGSLSRVVDDESMVEIDGFEQAAPFLGAPSKDESNGPSLGDSVPLFAAPGVDETASPQSRTMSAGLTTRPVSSADVWLTGTIEDAEPKERIELPQRISGGPNESSIVR